ncbi:cytochrome b561 [Pseudovibrio ascidiaceicola]|uniref:Cytochrome b561 n=1 Tax=Pseudovibrio ascidiaceicola TaxID=285279 RepID=A0A1I3WLP8_9HYPH|nr:cytochrome b/b6 domain-containing protein [Pseudovibrio ascidiaceicola]SFK08270.1 cytochrome b561 [Pseudovibrio ascidiaceicola]
MTTRYHPVLVALHWILALMIFMALVVGGPIMAAMESTDPQKLTGMTGHIIWGMVVGVLLLLRLITRFVTMKPAKANTGKTALNTAAGLTHWAMYALVAGMVLSGLVMANNADLFAITLGGSGDPLPADLAVYPARVAHGVIANVLTALIVLHVGGWAFHQFILRDRLISRMWFGKRQAASQAEAGQQTLEV